MGCGHGRGLQGAEGSHELGKPVEAVEEEVVEVAVVHRQLLLLPQGVLTFDEDAGQAAGLDQQHGHALLETVLCVITELQWLLVQTAAVLQLCGADQTLGGRALRIGLLWRT